MAQARRRAHASARGSSAAVIAEPPVRLIKKYSNRKLYDTSSRHYITLDKIGELVREGENIQVVDRTSGEDLTAVTLSQVVLDNERKRHGAVSEKVLQQLVRAPREAVLGAVKQSISAGEDFVRQVEERVVRPQEIALEEALERALRRLKIPSQKDMSRLDRQLKDLSKRVDQLSQRPASPPRRTGKTR